MVIDALKEMTATAALALKLGEVDRATQHADGRPVTVTTHTVMLGLFVMQLWNQTVYGNSLDLGRMLSHVLVHDVTEIDPGDTSTMRALGPAAQAVKDAGEAACLERIRGILPRLAGKIDDYERQDTPEARATRLIDKMCPKLPHLFNGLAVPKAAGMTRDDLIDEHRRQGAKLRAEYPEFINLHQLFDEACAACEAAWGPE